MIRGVRALGSVGIGIRFRSGTSSRCSVVSLPQSEHLVTLIACALMFMFDVFNLVRGDFKALC